MKTGLSGAPGADAATIVHLVDEHAAVEPAALVERRHQLEALNGADAQPLCAIG